MSLVARGLIALSQPALALFAAAALAAAALAADLAPYRAAEARNEITAVAGRAFEERKKPDNPDVPLGGTVVTLLPDSEPFVAASQRIKADARNSLRAYLDAAAALKRLEGEYGRALSEAGAADLVLVRVVAADGTYTFPRVPAGEWIVLGRHEVMTHGATRRPNRHAREGFERGPAVTGYRSARVWMVRVSLRAGAPGTVDLTDRNVWFSGVAEESR